MHITCKILPIYSEYEKVLLIPYNTFILIAIITNWHTSQKKQDSTMRDVYQFLSYAYNLQQLYNQSFTYLVFINERTIQKRFQQKNYRKKVYILGTRIKNHNILVMLSLNGIVIPDFALFISDMRIKNFIYVVIVYVNL